jgi:hypothetical protein
MKIPVIMARIARTRSKPFKAGIRVINPQAIRQMASKNMPIFFVNLLMVLIPSFYEIFVCQAAISISGLDWRR